MSARIPESCEGVDGEHTGPVRFYRTGWRCSAHSPWAEAGQDEPQPGPGRPRDWATPPAAPTPNPRGKRHLAVVGTREEAS